MMSDKEFENIVLHSARRLYSIAFRILRIKEEAEDAVQETYLKLWRMKNRLEEYKSVEALAVTAVKNHCLDLIRKRKNETLAGIDSAGSITGVLPTPFEVLRSAETGEIIESILDKMPPGYSEIIRMRDIEGQDYDEIALVMNQNINSVRVKVSRARKMLRDEYLRVEYEGCESYKRASR